MNIKIIYKKRLHKVPNQVQTVESIRTYIQSAYKNTINPNFKLLSQDPSDNFELCQISNDQELKNAIEMAKQFNFQSIKLLVHEGQEGINQQDLDLLNQSLLLSKVKQQGELQQKVEPDRQFETVSQQTEVKVQKDVEISNHPQQLDADIQTKLIENQSIETQAVVQMIEKGQDPEVPERKFEFVVPGVDSAKFEEYINHLIDKRLNQLGFLQGDRVVEQPKKIFQIQTLPAQEVEQPVDFSVPEMFLDEISGDKFDVELGADIEWIVIVRNKGKYQWPENVVLSCLEGQFKDFTQKVDALKPNERCEVKFQLKPTLICKNETQTFKLQYNNGNKWVQFGQKIQFTLNVSEKIKVQSQLNQSIQSSNTDKNLISRTTNEAISKAKILKDLFPQLSLADLLKFINNVGPELTIDELIENLCYQHQR